MLLFVILAIFVRPCTPLVDTFRGYARFSQDAISRGFSCSYISRSTKYCSAIKRPGRPNPATSSQTFMPRDSVHMSFCFTIELPGNNFYHPLTVNPPRWQPKIVSSPVSHSKTKPSTGYETTVVHPHNRQPWSNTPRLARPGLVDCHVRLWVGRGRGDTAGGRRGRRAIEPSHMAPRPGRPWTRRNCLRSRGSQ